MISEHSSEIVRELRPDTARSGEAVELLIFANDLTLAISSHALALYRSPDYFGDPLGNGLINSLDLPADAALHSEDGRFVSTIQSGCVTLVDDRILLILPNEARLYTDRESALYNRNPQARLSLTG